MRLGINTLYMVPGDVGGTETYLRETLLAALKEYPETEFILFTNLENDGLFRKICSGNTNVTYVCLNFRAANRPLRIIQEQVKLPIVAKKYRLDILWSPGYTAPFLSFSPQVVTICDLQYKSFPEDMSRLERLVFDVLVRGACRICDSVLAISEFSRQEVIRYNFAPPEKVHTVLLGADESFGKAYPEEEQNRILNSTLGHKRPYILCVAHTYPHKKVHVLVDAFLDVMDKIPHKLVIVGRERRGEALVKEAMASLKDASRIVRFKDGLPYKTLQILFRSADMFVLPSAYEGFGLPVVEAMMAGVPVITTTEASLKEVAGNCAFKIESIDKKAIANMIIKVSKLSEQERSKVTKAGILWAESFTWQRSASTMFDVFHEIQQEKAKVR